MVLSYEQSLQKLCFWNDCNNRGFGSEILETFLLNMYQIKL